MITLQSYVNGAWVAGQGPGTSLHNPTTGQAIATCGTAGIDMRAAVEHARDVGGPNLRRVGFAERARWLKALTSIHLSW